MLKNIPCKLSFYLWLENYGTAKNYSAKLKHYYVYNRNHLKNNNGKSWIVMGIYHSHILNWKRHDYLRYYVIFQKLPEQETSLYINLCRDLITVVHAFTL